MGNAASSAAGEFPKFTALCDLPGASTPHVIVKFSGGELRTPLLRSAPIYDMLPMLYAPLAGGEIPVREFKPTMPLPSERADWQAACEVALSF